MKRRWSRVMGTKSCMKTVFDVGEALTDPGEQNVSVLLRARCLRLHALLAIPHRCFQRVKGLQACRSLMITNDIARGFSAAASDIARGIEADDEGQCYDKILVWLHPSGADAGLKRRYQQWYEFAKQNYESTQSHSIL